MLIVEILKCNRSQSYIKHNLINSSSNSSKSTNPTGHSMPPTTFNDTLTEETGFLRKYLILIQIYKTLLI